MKLLTLPKLDYEYSDLEPVIPKRIMELHHSVHHAGYVKGANSALETLAKARSGEMEINVKAVMKDLSFNLNGHLLHEIFWKVMKKPVNENTPEAKIKEALEKNFGSIPAFMKEFADAAKSVEGSGWAALMVNADGDMVITQIEKHNLMSIVGYRCILCIDVWEHAYYLGYENRRGEYVDKFWQIVNWENVEKLLMQK
ncbi:superoxide dismutase [Candidatus Nomurabacteria bacterium]|nr:superoxide dismutase [Candidatus Nomurabacteria bacterium]